jgi:hypothetical protein
MGDAPGLEEIADALAIDSGDTSPEVLAVTTLYGGHAPLRGWSPLAVQITAPLRLAPIGYPRKAR